MARPARHVVSTISSVASGVNAFFETRHVACTGMAYHRHESPYVTVVLEGSYTEVFDDAPRTYRRGDVIVHHAREEHADHFSSATRCLNTQLLLQPDARAGPIGMSDDIAAATRRLIDAYANGDREQLHRTFAQLRATAAGRVDEAAPPAWLDEVIRFDEWVEAVPLQRLAKRCGVHPTHFSREFRRYMGTTPSDHRRRMRVESASKLLLNTDRTLAHVAIACGFTDQSHLNRAFAMEVGLSPGQYRRTFTR